MSQEFTEEFLSTIIKAYDIRGLVGDQVTPEFTRAVGAAFTICVSADRFACSLSHLRCSLARRLPIAASSSSCENVLGASASGAITSVSGTAVATCSGAGSTTARFSSDIFRFQRIFNCFSKQHP